ncbi:DNA-binding MarR family transcriptional regulator [Agromyces flavus]|uniref:DNA-binding MarR family transcriptional regulator n=1 Tax=Agromyces flavus TaxID=589382 RepID=A0A1H1X8U6_9MICO|nr:helix-turn-helix domain-containing GNAT family N-acetyltransferase [Agromyces flavus]MCP2366345.1 DNA-binding MarR family transcriptional regulator [Agromyces flavus]GGI44490.1 putative transcriptional regulator, MarR family protein [Agromyces flavus]SDT04999.1 DNA-binding transcriptional regulator, MarR family [Agromyces flavus]
MASDVALDPVATVRAFNRTVTERVGALEETYLARGRSLGASRLLWEIGRPGADVRELRARLGLDSGYLSRLLRGLESEGLVDVTGARGDARVRRATLTDAGRAELERLDAASDRLAASVLDPLPPARRARLVEAMATVARLLDAGQVVIERADAASADARTCLDRYYDELARRFPHGFDVGRSLHPGTDEFAEPHGAFLLARLHGRAIGCGGVLFEPDGTGYLKRMWVADDVRGMGVGGRLLAALEAAARERGCVATTLETNASLTEAIAMYRASGYAEVPAFNDEFYADHWFRKDLV